MDDDLIKEFKARLKGWGPGMEAQAIRDLYDQQVERGKDKTPVND